MEMKLSTVVKALASLCLLLTDGYLVSEDGSPTIIGPHRVRVPARPGEQMFLHCEAFSNCDQTLIYWLVNGTFPEDAPSSGRIVESDEATMEDGAFLHKSLLLKNITSEDFKSTFTCVVANAAGMTRKYTTLTKTNNCCEKVKKVRKVKKHRM